MILFLVVAVVLAVSVTAFLKVHFESGWHFLAFTSMLTSGVALFTLCAALFINRGFQRESLVRMAAFRDTLAEARNKNISEMERAAILAQIASWNQWLAAEKYWNEGFFDIFHIDDVASIKPLK